jgi:hypothetical protein
MRVPRRAVPIQPITYLWERHKEIARMQVAGMKPIEISKKLGMTPCRMSIIMNSPVYIKYIGGLSKDRNDLAFDMRKELMECAVSGVPILKRIMTEGDTSKSLKAKIAQDFLDRTGFGKVAIQKTENVHIHLTADRLTQLKEERAKLLKHMNTSNTVEDAQLCAA